MNGKILSMKIRLSPIEIDHIIEAFKKHFPQGDGLWIFGSRVDMQAKGGDIDLYVETSLEDLDALVSGLTF
jgi:hypothetical protein